MKYKVIAIDGPAGAGKSTVAKLLSKKIGFIYIDSGALFRAITLKIIRLGIDIDDVESIIHHAKKSTIDFIDDKIYLDGENVSREIRQDKINKNVSYIAMISEVREIVVDIQRKIASNKNVVVDGRDIGTTVFPEAYIKFYLTASVEERARRRYNEHAKKANISFEEIKNQIIKRDYLDSNRKSSPLKKAKDSITIETTGKNIDQVIKEMLHYISMKGDV